VKQKLERDYPRMLDQEDDAAAPMVMSRGEAIKKKSNASGPVSTPLGSKKEPIRTVSIIPTPTTPTPYL
jgi:hypothetical protein